MRSTNSYFFNVTEKKKSSLHVQAKSMAEIGWYPPGICSAPPLLLSRCWEAAT